MIREFTYFIVLLAWLFPGGKAFVSKLNAQDFVKSGNQLFEHYHMENGLPNNHVLSLLQDQHGFLWVGTRNGLVKYDGYDFFPIYPIPNDSFHLKGREAQVLYEDSKGNIWIGTGTHGLYSWNPKTSKFAHFNHELDNPNSLGHHEINGISEDAIGAICITLGYSNGFNRIQLNDETNNYTITRFLPIRLPVKLYHIIDSLNNSGRQLSALLEVPSNKNLLNHFTLSKETDILVVAMGAKVPGIDSDWADNGWIENEKGERIWSMSVSKSYHAGGRQHGELCIEVDVINLGPGNYRLGYYTDHYRAFGDWKNQVPDRPEYYGIQLLKLKAGEGQNVQQILKKNPFNASILDSHVGRVFRDEKGNVWITSMYGLTKMTIVENKPRFQHILPSSDNPLSLPLSFPAEMTKARDGTTWIWGMGIGWSGGKVTKMEPNSQQFHLLDYSFPPNNWFSGLLEDNKGRLWVGATQTGLYQFNPPFFKKDQLIESNRVQHFEFLYNDGGEKKVTGISSILEDKAGMIWVGTNRNGLYKLNPFANQFPFHVFDRNNPMFEATPIAMLEDENGSLWFATKAGKLYFFDPTTNLVSKPIFEIDSPHSSIFQDKKGGIWLGTSGKGLFYSENGTGQNRGFVQISASNLSSPKITAINEDEKGNLWVGTMNGINVFKAQSKTWQTFFHDEQDSTTITHNYIKEIYQDNKNRIWIQTQHGGVDFLTVEEMPDGTFNLRIKHYGSNEPLYDFLEDSEGNFLGAGYGLFDLFDFPFIQLPGSFPNVPLRDVRLFEIFEDSQNRIWVGSENHGIFLYNSKNEELKGFTSREGLLYEHVHSILEDAHEGLWMVHPKKGISRMDLSNGIATEEVSFRNFQKQQGLLLADKLTGQSLKTSKGFFVIPLSNGFYFFHPDSLHSNPNVPVVVFTDFQLFNKSIEPGYNSILEKAIRYTQEIKLHYDQNFIALAYTGLHFDQPQDIRYVYRMIGMSDEWISVGGERMARFNNLSPGDYRFQVKAQSRDGIWSEVPASINISVAPPWWAKGWAFLSYFILSLVAILAWRRYEVKRLQLKHALNIKAVEAKKLKEVDEMKSRFFANLSHEFRTPMTVILGMADQLKENPSRMLEEGVRLIKRNGRNVLHLINQMLDLSKLESGTMQFNFIQGDLLQYLWYLGESFHSLASTQNIQLDFNSDLDEAIMDYDPEKILSIVSNLLSNAIKFTPPGGLVSIEVQKALIKNYPHIKIEVKDTGIGIPKESLNSVFDRFFQVSKGKVDNRQGTGIGLSLTRELVEKLGGNIQVDSILGEGSAFIIFLPVHNHAPKITGLTELSLIKKDIEPFLQAGALSVQRKLTKTVDSKQTNISFDEENIQMPLLLIIEDNSDVRKYLESCLESEYRIIHAVDGGEGIDKAFEFVPDIIISDVMMPKKDGFEVCQILKYDEKTSHIPIILLTARATSEDRLTGLKRGADAYLAKPFDKEELFIRLQKLLELRQTLQNRYRQLEIPLTDLDSSYQIEDTFLLKLKSTIEEHIADEHLGQELLCKLLGMSRAQLYRKVSALTGKSVSLYIRSLRLRKAKELLRTTQLNISEIAYDVGFHNPSRLSEYFQKEYGQSPTDFRK